jgi:hypothetical protein
MTLQQLPLLPDDSHPNAKTKRSGTFVDNMRLPIHRWFRYSAGFSAEWVEQILRLAVPQNPNMVILDPFAGSGTVSLVADKVGLDSFGIEAHPFVARVAKAKLLWNTPLIDLQLRVQNILDLAAQMQPEVEHYPELVHRCFKSDALNELDQLRQAWIMSADETNSSALTWLALTAILRSASFVGTAQWQYILPNRTKKVTSRPFEAFESQAKLMTADMRAIQKEAGQSLAQIMQSDARNCPLLPNETIDFIISSPPYANNYDYADATRFEMSFWGEVGNWGDLHDAVRQFLITSSAQHASKDRLNLELILANDLLEPIRVEISEVCWRLADVRHQHGGKKHYHTMIAAYFVDMARVWQELRRVSKIGSRICFVIGDSAPYGIHVPVERWLGELAIAAGFQDYQFTVLRQRNIKWENRKHRVPLHEGHLWING